MRRLPDIIIAIGVIFGVVALGTGLRVIGAVSIFVALIVGWKRQWCMDTLDELISTAGYRSHGGEPLDPRADESQDDAGEPH